LKRERERERDREKERGFEPDPKDFVLFYHLSFSLAGPFINFALLSLILLLSL
jgi:hypothetical protein